MIETLPNKCKTIFKLIYFEDASTDEVAEKLHISPRNVLNQKRRALQLLKKKLLVAVFISFCLNGSTAYKQKYGRMAENIAVFPICAE
jgi:RNA polymerase sigma-70 factor (ECF subfamily)